MNKVILVGRLTRDPVVRVTPSNKDVASFTLAVDRFSVGPDGKKEADFVPIVVWGRLAEVCGNNLTKGQKVLVDGRMQVRNYEDKTGQKRYVTEVVAQSVEFLEWRGGQSGAPAAEGLPSGAGSFGPDIYPDDDVPF
jgi:single-strand DNA-binding protein